MVSNHVYLKMPLNKLRKFCLLSHYSIDTPSSLVLWRIGRAREKQEKKDWSQLFVPCLLYSVLGLLCFKLTPEKSVGDTDSSTACTLWILDFWCATPFYIAISVCLQFESMLSDNWTRPSECCFHVANRFATFHGQCVADVTGCHYVGMFLGCSFCALSMLTILV